MYIHHLRPVRLYLHHVLPHFGRGQAILTRLDFVQENKGVNHISFDNVDGSWGVESIPAKEIWSFTQGHSVGH